MQSRRRKMTNKPVTTLLPCPFCGGEAELLGDNKSVAKVHCLSCYSSCGFQYTKDAAIKFWNKRKSTIIQAESSPTGHNWIYERQNSTQEFCTKCNRYKTAWTAEIPCEELRAKNQCIGNELKGERTEDLWLRNQ